MTTPSATLLGDARAGKLAGNVAAFGRALRRAGVPVDAARIALAQQALLLVGVQRQADVAAALEAVLVSREQDRAVFRELFQAFFRDPEIARKLLAQMLPAAEGQAKPPAERPRVREALAPHAALPQPPDSALDKPLELDAAMTASDLQRLRNADFSQLTASEYQMVDRLVRDLRLPVPEVPARRVRAGVRGARVHWTRTLSAAARTGGEIMTLHRLQRQRQPLPLLLLVDVSGSMERYARLLLAFLHAATREIHHRRVRRDVFTFGTRLTDLTSAFRLGDTDAMLQAASRAISDYGGGTRLGESLATLHRTRTCPLVGRRTLVLIVSDGLDTGEPAELARELQWLKRRSRRILWLNPLLRFSGYQPQARGAVELFHAADAMLAVHNVQSLHELAGAVAALMRP
ncbi:MAG: VWA domain-containing protein [Burkholderiaceae bacterium]|jgi:uncharacterized protein with von Willebrand factor type A (vWA) domain|nr:VWA domain-containing protein [Burkholderiaceae bacterium]